jgi:hypothetical protein
MMFRLRNENFLKLVLDKPGHRGMMHLSEHE